MKHAIDLMPRSCREAIGRRARIRRWTSAYIVAAGVLVGGWVWGSAGQQGMSSRRDRLAEEVKLQWERNDEVQRLLDEIATSEKAITRYYSLAWPIRVTEVIDALGAAIPSSVTLGQLTATPRTKSRHDSATGMEKTHEAYLVIELEGITRDRKAVADLVSGLESNPLFETVTLDYTRTIQIDHISARTFRLNCEVNLLSKYAFAGLDEFGEDE